MKNYYSISIPKPCHEDWKQMTPKEKGRFCDSCTKTVIDFTKMNTFEIQDFIHENKNNKVCGHFKQIQLDSINLHVPSQVLEQKQNFHKIFFLALLITMGTSLMNCTNKNGDKQKIDSIEVIDDKSNIIDITLGLPYIEKIDSLPKKNCSEKSNAGNKKQIPKPLIDPTGLIAVETILGGVIIIETPPVEIDSIITIEPPPFCPFPEKRKEDEGFVIGFIQVESPPEFKPTPQNLSTKEKRDYFSNKINDFISNNFKAPQGNINLHGRQKIQVQFKIDSLGNVIDIKARAPYPLFEKEAKRVIELLPQFIPAKHKDKPVTTVYTLPIIFQIEE